MSSVFRGYMKNFLRQSSLTLLIFGLLLTAALILADRYVCRSTSDRILTYEEAADVHPDCILVLGAGVRGNIPSPMLEDRLKTGIALYQNGTADRLLMSGDHGRKDYDEVNVMKNYAIEHGVPSSNIFMDHAGFSTYESVYRARNIFGARKIIIVTQPCHKQQHVSLLYDAQALGLDAYGVASDSRDYKGQLYRDFREILARGKDFLYGIFQPPPTYLGETISLYGNGDVTNDR